MNPNARIASLLRELAEAFDALADEQPKRPRQQRKNNDAASLEALRKVQDGLRRRGVTNGKQA